MPDVLILGATGFIGNALCLSLLRSGSHRVYGLARTAEKGRNLAIQEITPVVCADPVADGTAYLNAIREQRIDVVVDATGANAGSVKLLSDVKEVAVQRMDAAKKGGIAQPPKLAFVYVSGTWTHGDSIEPVSDLTPVGVENGAPTAPADLVVARVGWEKDVLNSRDVLDVAVVRPAMVYGRDSSSAGLVLKSVVEAAMGEKASQSAVVRAPFAEASAPGFVHVDDLAEGLRGVVEKLPVLSGTGVWPVFDFVTSQERVRHILEGAARVLGYEGKIELVGPPDDVFMKAMNTTFNGDSSRAKQLLGWEPKRLGFVQHIDVYARLLLLRWRSRPMSSQELA